MDFARCLLLCLPFAFACGSKTPPAQTPVTSETPAPTPEVAPPADPPAQPASADLSTAEKARTTIYETLKRGDAEAFKAMVSKRMHERHDKHWDEWYGVWKTAADKGGPDKFTKITLVEEDGQFKLDEN